MSLLSQIRDRWEKRKAPPLPLSAAWDDEAISQVQPSGVLRLRWSDVDIVAAYKKDCYTVDQIRLLIMGPDGGIECTEEAQDMILLGEAVSRFLPGSLPDWYLQLASKPAFETSMTYVYRSERMKKDQIGERLRNADNDNEGKTTGGG